MTIKVATETVTPAMASSYLKLNQKNRVPSKAQVATLSSYMENGLWEFDGSPIRFSAAGTLLDGQHRLLAVVKSQTSQDFVVVRGVSEGSQLVMDTGKKRSLADAISMDGHANANNIAAAVSATYKWEVLGLRNHTVVGGSFAFYVTPTIAEQKDFFEKNKKPILDATATSLKLYQSPVPVAPRIVSLAAYLFSKISTTDSDYFFDKLISGAGLPEDSAILVFRNRLIKMHSEAQKNKAQPNVYLQLALMIKAWNFYRNGVAISRIQYSLGGANPEKFPTPE